MIDLMIVLSYLAITLIVGIKAGKNTNTMTEFSVAGRNYNTTVMVATTCATLVASEDVMYASQKVFEIGILYTLVALGIPLAAFITAYFVIPRFAYIPYKKYISVGELIGSFYGEKAQIITGLAATLRSIGVIGGQVCAIGYCCDYFLGLSHFTGVILGAGILTVYSAFGGVKSVTLTDVMQFGMLLVIIPVTASIGVEIFGWKSFLAHLPPGHLSLSIPEGKSAWDYISLFIILSVPGLGPCLIQRFLMSRNTAQMKEFMKITGLLGILFLFSITMIGLAVVVMAPEVEPSKVFPYFVNQLLPVGIRGFAIAGMLAVIMSTADSFLNTASICLVHDVLGPLSKNTIDDKTQLKLTRYVTVAIGMSSIFATLTHHNIMDIVLIFGSFWLPVVTIPLFLTLWNFKGTSQGFIAASMSGLATALGFMVANSSFGFGGLVPGMVVNLVVFVVVSKLTRKKRVDPVPMDFKVVEA
jgi:solute:Na+ symporter, SSS family